MKLIQRKIQEFPEIEINQEMDKLINIDQFVLSENGSSIQEVRFYKMAKFYLTCRIVL